MYRSAHHTRHIIVGSLVCAPFDQFEEQRIEQWQMEWAQKGEERAIAHRKMLEAVLTHPDNEPEKALRKALQVGNPLIIDNRGDAKQNKNCVMFLFDGCCHRLDDLRDRYPPRTNHKPVMILGKWGCEGTRISFGQTRGLIWTDAELPPLVK